MLANMDAGLRLAAENKEVPGVVAMAATDRGVLYEGAFGLRDLAQPAAMARDTVFRIASMTKAVTSVAAMQLVEEGRLDLDQPVGDVVPELASPQVLEGFEASGAPHLRPAKTPITLRRLLTHTAGFGYEMLSPELIGYVKQTGMPSTSTGQLAALRLPLLFDPGERWEYGINIDWVGRIVEAVSGKPLDAYFAERIFRPLGMADAGFAPSAEQKSRLATVHLREPDGSLVPIELNIPPANPEFWAGGGALYATAPDYLRFLRMLLGGGRLDRAQVLRPDTVTLMAQNHIGELAAGQWRTAMPNLSNDLDLFPGTPCRWGLGYMISMAPGPHGRSAGSLTWAGLFNSYYWIDPQKQVTGVILTQILPFADPHVLRLYGEFERGIYGELERLG
jgi:CubicO group peptidase (beta-lactamase class C family)